LEVFYVNGWYAFLLATLRVIGVLALVGFIARGFVAFGVWRTGFRNRLIGIETREHSRG
jgi:hypothetical protein